MIEVFQYPQSYFGVKICEFQPQCSISVMIGVLHYPQYYMGAMICEIRPQCSIKMMIGVLHYPQCYMGVMICEIRPQCSISAMIIDRCTSLTSMLYGAMICEIRSQCSIRMMIGVLHYPQYYMGVMIWVFNIKTSDSHVCSRCKDQHEISISLVTTP